LGYVFLLGKTIVTIEEGKLASLKVEYEMVENVKALLKAHAGLKHEVYLDIENSSLVPKEVVDAMIPYYYERAYGSPHKKSPSF
jgi:hypothetical protein